jgi:hypothetical protein
MFEQGSYIEIEKTILTPEERTAQLPEDTKKVPFKLWTKGFACTSGDIGDTVTIETITGRHISGKVTCIAPHYTHSYGEVMPEIMMIGRSLRTFLEEEDHD